MSESAASRGSTGKACDGGSRGLRDSRLGMFMQSVMLLAREAGLDPYPQEV